MQEQLVFPHHFRQLAGGGIPPQATSTKLQPTFRLDRVVLRSYATLGAFASRLAILSDLRGRGD